MMPAHCKTVSFKRVGFPLTAKEIELQLAKKKVFTRTDYFILENSGKVAVARVAKKRGIELFREVTAVEVLSLPESTVMVRDPSCDVLDVHSMTRKATQHPEETVVVLGAFEHVSFIKGGKEPARLRVIDFVPPHPSKTLRMVEDVLRSGMVRTPLLVEPVMVDVLERLKGCGSDIVMFPCEAGRLEIGGRPVLYLDKTPPIDEKKSVTLAGCPLSLKIFRHVYHREPQGFENVCPRELARQDRGRGKLHIARCCDIHGVKVEGDLALVPYGASMRDMAEAVNALCEKARPARDP
jgi:hypothetical protein